MMEELNESPGSYKPSMRIHIESLIGIDATDRLYKEFGITNAILQAEKEDYLRVLNAEEAEILYAARKLSFENVTEQVIVRCSSDCFSLFSFLSDKEHEEFWIAMLSRNNVVMNIVHISSGGITGTVVDIKLIVRKIMKCVPVPNAIILAHNHPSGNTAPSKADMELTEKIVKAMALLDVKVLDHIIIGHDKYLSFLDEGYM
jgi:DNA repair protein RadC